MEQFEQLLTCAICLDRYRNPKLLPCQHSFCMEPCMDGLVDYVRRQVKCPECRAEHRIPYQGVQGFPTNVTLQRFLELHIEITGELPDPTSGQIMKRCSVCSEKAYCTLCLHCDKDVCPECKNAHKDILKREISRINNQIRRAVHRLQDILTHVEKNMLALQQNCTSVSEEVEEVYNRLNKALKDRTEYLRNEVDKYLTTEHKHLSSLKENLEVEISNIQSNCDLADKYMQTEVVDWDDCELMDAKEIFLKTVEFIRYFESEPVDYTRRAKFTMTHDPNQLVLHVSGYGDITINMSHQTFFNAIGGNMSASTGNMLQPPSPGLMRSKSDHRLTSQYRQQDDRAFDSGIDHSDPGSLLGGRKFGERYASRNASGTDRYEGRYGNRSDRSNDYAADYDSSYDNDSGRIARSRLRSRLARHGHDNADSDTDVQGTKSVRFSDTNTQHPKERERVLDTEDVAKGPISGITRLYDSPRVMKRIQECENKSIKKEKEQQIPAAVQQKFQPAAVIPTQRRSNSNSVGRQVSEEDEISRIKRQNKNAPPPTSSESHTRGSADRAGSGHRREEDKRDERQVTTPIITKSSTEQPRKTPAREAASSEENTDEEEQEEPAVSSLQQKQQQRKPPTQGINPKSNVSENSRRSADVTSQLTGIRKKSGGSASSDSSTSSESSTAVRNTGAVFTTDELKQQYLARSSRNNSDSKASGADSNSDNNNCTPRNRPPSTDASKKDNTPTATSSTSSSRFQNRFLGGGNRSNSNLSNKDKPKTENVQPENDDEEEEEEEEEDSSSSTSTESDDTESEEEMIKKDTQPATKPAMEKTDIGPLLARSAQARDAGGNNTSGYRRSSRDDGYSRYNSNSSDGYKYPYSTSKDARGSGSGGGGGSGSGGGSKYLSRHASDESEPKPHFRSRFLNKSKSSAMAAPNDENDYQSASSKRYGGGGGTPNEDKLYSSSSTGGTRDRYTTFKDRKARLARSKSSHGFGADEPDDADDAVGAGGHSSSASSYYPASYLASKGAAINAAGGANDLSRSRSSHVLKSRENSPEHPLITSTGADKDGSSLSSWARYLKNKYGSRGKDTKESSLPHSSSNTPSSSTSTPRRLSLGLPLRHNSSNVESSDDDQKNLKGSPNSPTAATMAQAGFTEVGTTLRSQYMQKRHLLFKIGSRGSEPGYFTWPRGIAVGPDNSIVVADSSNHRVQVFDQNGRFVKEFGSYGNKEGEFDCLAGIAVNRIGQFIIADRYNHRIQVLDPSGRFLRSFGSQGTADGKFNYPWGITTDPLGFIYVCDKENHRVQVFQSDGTFVGKFGSCGTKVGQLEHPQHIAVSNTNRVIVSDSNNHRVQIFDVNGRVLSAIGCEGSAEGQFKFPRGVAVDDQGYILVGDSGNNRIQIFHPDGTFLRAFGCWGSGDGEFKGLEGIAVMPNGNILVCDRENHRIQAF